MQFICDGQTLNSRYIKYYTRGKITLPTYFVNGYSEYNRTIQRCGTKIKETIFVFAEKNRMCKKKKQLSSTKREFFFIFIYLFMMLYYYCVHYTWSRVRRECVYWKDGKKIISFSAANDSLKFPETSGTPLFDSCFLSGPPLDFLLTNVTAVAPGTHRCIFPEVKYYYYNTQRDFIKRYCLVGEPNGQVRGWNTVSVYIYIYTIPYSNVKRLQ